MQLGANPQARLLTKTLGLPLSLPPPLRRARGPWQDRPLADQTVVVGAAPSATDGTALRDSAIKALAVARANPLLVTMPASAPPSAALGAFCAACGHPLSSLGLQGQGQGHASRKR